MQAARSTALELRARCSRALDWEATIDGALNNVVRLASGGALALCECGLEMTTDAEGEAWMWLLDHHCAGECDS